MKKVLAFFGAFNPPTKAHVKLAKLAMEQTNCEGVLLVPSKASYIVEEQKKSFAFSDTERIEMIHYVNKHDYPTDYKVVYDQNDNEVYYVSELKVWMYGGSSNVAEVIWWKENK